MTDRTWSVRFEFTPDDENEDQEGAREIALLEALEAVGADAPVTGGSPVGRLSTRFCVDALDEFTASILGATTLSDALEKAGIRVTSDPMDIEIMTLEELVADNTQSLPRFLGAADIAAMLEVSRQRVYQLRDEQAFPAPVAALARGELWDRRDVVRWSRSEWRREPGRPKAATGS